jgi:hypothetical protein
MVGRALALVRMRTRYALTILNNDDVQVDLATYETARRMLQPFSEGLALFAEFDLAPGQSPMESGTLTALKMCFGFPLSRNSGQTDPELIAQALLQNTRRRPEFILTRKVPVYSESFDLEDDGYLAGYLAIKNLWTVFARRVEVDRDLFLSYLRVYFYEDPVLADLLLAPAEESEILAAQAVAQRINDRFQSLIETLEASPQEPRNFAELVSRGEPNWLATTGCSKDEYARAQGAFTKCVQEFFGKVPPKDQTVRTIVAACTMQVQHRGEMVVAAEPVRLLCQDRKWLAVLNTGESIDLPQAAGLVETEDATYSIAVAKLGTCLVEGVLVDGKWVQQRVSGLTDDASTEAVRLMMNTRHLRRNISDLMEKETQRLIGEQWLQVVLGKIRANTFKWNLELYLSLATLIVAEDRVDEVKALIREGGLEPFIPCERDALAMAAVSLANTIPVTSEPVALVHFWGRLAGLSAEAMEAAIDDLRHRRPYPLLFGDEKGIYATV